MADQHEQEQPSVYPEIRKAEPTYVHNIQQVLGCMPVLGSISVGILGLIGFGVGMQRLSRADEPGWIWLIGANLGLIASGIGFGVLSWLVWSNRRE
jgi:hypothetical protein